MIPLLTFLAVVALIAHLESSSDTDRIKNGLPIDHAGQLIERMVVCGGSLMAIAAVSKSVEWRTLLWIPAGWSVFTIAFRWMLNRKRWMDWRYVSESNDYDRFFMSLVGVGYGGYITPYTGLKRFGQFYNTIGSFKRKVHRAGLLAYAFEAAVLIASLTLYAWAR